MHTCVHAYICLYMHTDNHMYIFICAYVYMYMFMYAYMHPYMYMFIFVYMCACIIHVCVYIQTIFSQLAIKNRHTHRQCFSTRRLRAIFSPSSVHTGLVRMIFPKSALMALTLPPVDKDPMFTMSTSFLDSF